MNVTLDQAIEIHAKALAKRAGVHAAVVARDRARRCFDLGDCEGHRVWLRVADTAAEIADKKAATPLPH